VACTTEATPSRTQQEKRAGGVGGSLLEMDAEGEQQQSQSQSQSQAQSQSQWESAMVALATADARERSRSGVDMAAVSFTNARGLIRVELARSVIPSGRSVLLEMRNRQMSGEMSSLLETADANVPLTQEVLREKHLATYYGMVTIGDTKFRILFDTGSCEFWVPSSACDMDRCKKHIQYPMDEHSSSRFMARKKLNIQYLSGRVSGDMVYETVHTGDVTVQRQIVGIADHVDIVLLDDVIWDGILGLAYPNKVLTARGVVPFFDNVINTRALQRRGLANQFGYYIDDSKGSVTFGGVDCTLVGNRGNCIKHFGFVPVSEKTYWTIRLNDVRVQYPGKKAMTGFCPAKGCKAIVDTGTYLLYGPGAAVRKMLRRAKFAGCSSYERLPTFTFDFRVDSGSPPVQLSLRPIDYVLKFDNGGNSECVTGISPDKDVIWTLGQVFLRSFYTVFDRDLNRIGFARLPRTEFQAINAHADAEQQMLIERSAGANLNDLFASAHAPDADSPVVWAQADADTHTDTDADSDSDADTEEADAGADESDEA